MSSFFRATQNADHAVTHRTQRVSSIDGLVGRTPMLRLRRMEVSGGGQILAKLESHNPSGSVKDRAALAIVRSGEVSGQLHAGRILLDASSGNTAIAYAMICASRGYRCEICVPSNCSAERKRLLGILGASLVLTDPSEGTDGAIAEARRRVVAEPDRYFYADQYSNAANVDAHFHTTGPEILEQTGGRITHFVCMVGTSGTFVGTGRRLRRHNPEIRLIQVQPDDAFHGIEGAKHMASALKPDIYDADLADGTIYVKTEHAQQTAVEVARREGVLAGVSAGANIWAAQHVAHGADLDSVIVTILPDSAQRYLSEPWTG